MRILNVLSYYRPYTSGLTIHAERLAVALAHRGHEVTVLTSHHDPTLPRRDRRDGVEILRVPVRGRLGKTPIMPGFAGAVVASAGRSDVVHLHLPQADGAVAALAARLRGRAVVATSHCDAVLPGGRLSRLATALSRASDHCAACLASRVLTYTADYARHSRFLSRWRHRLEVVPPPVLELACLTAGATPLTSTWNLEGRRPVIGMATRLAAEKGVDVLVEALPHIVERCPEVVVAFAGQHQGVPGEDAVARQLGPTLDRLVSAGRWRFLGVLDEAAMAAFYRAIDVLVVPSLNPTESFGLVQVEAMLAGRPVVAADLPGVRQSVLQTGLGRLVRPGDAVALAGTVLEVLDDPPTDPDARKRLSELHDPERIAARVEMIYRDAIAGRAPSVHASLWLGP